MINRIFTILFITSVMIACNDEVHNYEVISYNIDSYNNATYSVFSEDTFWIEMKRYAEELTKNKSQASSVTFFYPREKAALIKDNHAYDPGSSIKYRVAIYKFDDEKERFSIIKGENRDLKR